MRRSRPTRTTTDPGWRASCCCKASSTAPTSGLIFSFLDRVMDRRITLLVSRSSLWRMKCSNCSALGNLQNFIAPLIVSVPFNKAVISRGCAFFRIIFTLLTLRVPTPAASAICCRTSIC